MFSTDFRERHISLLRSFLAEAALNLQIFRPYGTKANEFAYSACEKTCGRCSWLRNL